MPSPPVRDHNGNAAWWRWAGSVALFLPLFVGFSGLEAQELPVRMEPGVRSFETCPPGPGTISDAQDDPVTPARAREAERLLREATQANILGEHDLARAYLREAAIVDPSSGAVAYRLARTLEDLEQPRQAHEEYCRYLALEDDPSDGAEVEERIAALGEALGIGVPPAALESFAAGTEDLGEQRHAEAWDAFTQALAIHPDWPEAHYNRAVAKLALGAEASAVADLVRYLELAPDAEDQAAVRLRVQELTRVETRSHRPSTAFISGLLVPGMGQVYTGRPGRGFIYLALAGGSVAAGFLVREVEERCLAVPTDGTCPQGQVLERLETTPYRDTGIAVAGALTFLAAIQAFRRARAGSDGAQASRDVLAPEVGFSTLDHRVRVTPAVEMGWRGLGFGLHLSLQPLVGKR